MTRAKTPLVADELTMLRAFLDYHRETFRMKTAGLDAAQLNQALAPSPMTLGGMMKHLAVVETSWFEEKFAGGSMMAPFDTAPWEDDWDWEWHTAADDSPETLRALFEDACARTDRIIDAADGPDQLSVGLSKQGTPYSLRWLLMHMVEEYARHNGHADLIRESIDGATGT